MGENKGGLIICFFKLSFSICMKLCIILTSHRGVVELREGDRILSSREFLVDNDLSQNILMEINGLFKDIGKTPVDIECVEYSATNAGFTTTRIGQMVADTYNFVLMKDP